MKLNVPLIRQPKDSEDCGIAGLAMLFKYYKVPISFEDIKKEVEIDVGIGTYAPQLGLYLIKHGFDVEIVTMHPKVFTLQDIGISKQKITDRLNAQQKESKIERDKKVLGYFIEFLKKGGKMDVKIPAIEDIQSEIDNNNPVGALMTTNFINNNAPRFNFHFNVITGYDKDKVYTNDPLWDKTIGGKKKYTIQQFYYGLYASAYGDIDNASLMKIRMKKK